MVNAVVRQVAVVSAGGKLNAAAPVRHRLRKRSLKRPIEIKFHVRIVQIKFQFLNVRHDVFAWLQNAIDK